MLLFLWLAGLAWAINAPICSHVNMIMYARTGNMVLIEDCTAHRTTKIEPETINESIIAAACSNQLAVVKFYLQMGAVMTHDRQDLQCAAAMGYIDILIVLLSNDPGSASELTQPLLLAASNRQTAAAEILLRYGATPKSVVHCYKPIKWAPADMYTAISAKLPTCSELAHRVAADIKKEFPGMGLLDEDEDQRTDNSEREHKQR